MKLHLPDFIRFHAHPALSAMNLTALAVLVMALLDALLFVLNPDLQIWPGILFSFCLLLIAALLYAISFELLYQLARLLARPATYLKGFLSMIVPGLVAFILLAQPLLGDASMRNIMPFAYPYNQFGMLAVLVLLGSLAVYFWPSFRGNNAAFLLVAALASRLFLGMVLPDAAYSDLLGVLDRAVHMIILTALFYCNLHIRYRLQLSIGWEPRWIPWRVLKGGVFLTIAIGIIFLVINIYYLNAALTESIWGGTAVILLGIYVLQLIQWSLQARYLDRPGHLDLDGLVNSARRLSFTLLNLIVLAGFAVLPLLWMRPAHIGQITMTGGAASEVLHLAGYLLDQDGDGNSSWPGLDPMDRDACQRYDFKPDCASLVNYQQSLIGNNRQHGRVDAGAFHASRSLNFITIVGARAPDRSLMREFAANHNFAYTRILRPSDHNWHALRALLQDLDGPREFEGVQQPSILARFAASGYRTICTYNQSAAVWMRPANPMRLDAGCQILEPEKLVHKNSDQDAMQTKNDTLDFEAWHNHHKVYKEKRTLSWHLVHLQDGWQNENKTEFNQFLKGLPDNNPLVVLFMDADYLDARLWILHGAQKGKLSDYQELGGLLRQTAGASESVESRTSMVGVLYHPPLRPGIFRKIYTVKQQGVFRRPLATYRFDGRRFLLFDGLTGSRWIRKNRMP